jgi:HD-GYP domain-containing protein (c-di-GMP phosphodiesterase class II)
VSDDQSFIQDLADRAAQAVYNAQLYEEARRRLSNLQSLHTIDLAVSSSFNLNFILTIILGQALHQLQMDAASILLFDKLTHTLLFAAGQGFRTDALKHTTLHIGEGHAGRVALERTLVTIPDLAQDQEFRRSPSLVNEGFVAYFGVPLIVKGEVRGVLEVFQRAPRKPDAEWLSFLTTLAGQASIAIDNVTLFSDLQRSNMNLKIAYDTTLEGWSKALDMRDHETEGHTERVADMTEKLARERGMSEDDLIQVRRGALLHDIGKMAIPDAILLKPGPLTDEEWTLMRRHPEFAHELLWPIEYLRPALDIPWCHHEKWDGAGYPRGLKEEQIPLAARLFAVVDVWDALRSDRPYRVGWSDERVREHIRSQAGTHFDPDVVDLFLHLIRE